MTYGSQAQFRVEPAEPHARIEKLNSQAPGDVVVAHPGIRKVAFSSCLPQGTNGDLGAQLTETLQRIGGSLVEDAVEPLAPNPLDAEQTGSDQNREMLAGRRSTDPRHRCKLTRGSSSPIHEHVNHR